MAFVCQAQRRLHQYNKATQNVGPGQYNTFSSPKNNKILSAIVPFNSSSVKRSIYDKKIIMETLSSEKIGPGYYDISQSLVKNNIQTFVNNKSVIVKYNSLGSNQFKSVVPRFQSLQAQEGPGPGQYQSNVRSSTITQEVRKQTMQKRKVLRQKLQQFIQDLKKNKKIQYKPSIPSKTFKLQKNPNKSPDRDLENRQKNLTKQKYHKISSLQKQPPKLKGFSWYKSQRKSIIDVKNSAPERNIGPGKYYSAENSLNQKEQNSFYDVQTKSYKKRPKTQSSNFKSKSVRTFFDKLCFQTNLKQIAAERNLQHYKTSNPGPGLYDVQMGINKKLKKNAHNSAYQFFGSTVERFTVQPQNKQPNININWFQKPERLKDNSPNHNYVGQNKSFNRVKNAFSSDIQRKMTYLGEGQHQNILGPGQYQVPNGKAFKPKKGKIVQNFGNSKERFEPQIKQQMQASQLTQISNSLNSKNRKKNKKPNQSFMFKSKIKKQSFESKPEELNQLFGKYDTSHTDVSTKIIKQTTFLQNLKKIEVQIPAFNSSIQRFDYNKQKKHKSLQKQKIQNQKKNALFLNTKTEQVRQRLMQKNKQQIIRDKRSTIYNDHQKNDRFVNIQMKDQLRNPAVGQYSLRSNWTKQTYNIKYHTNYMKKEASQLSYTKMSTKNTHPNEQQAFQ